MNTRLHLTAYLAASVFALFGTHAYANSQQEKMTTCNADATAKKLSGDERKAYMKTCLSGPSSASAHAATAPAKQ